MASSHGVHDHSSPLVCLLSGWLHHLSCARWREIFRIHRLGGGGLLSDPGVARFAGVCDAAVGRVDARSGFSSPMGPAQADRALDHPHLAVRVDYRSPRLLNAVPMVSSTGALNATSVTTRKSLRCQNLALNGDLMFDQSDVPPRIKETLW